MSELITLAQSGYGEYIEKKSKFMAYALSVQNEKDAVAFIGEIKTKHWDAKHHVYAYVIGANQRSTDDGEPAGTAGRPVLEIIKNEGIGDAVVVVTRYFGGVLLGTGGLVRAYGKAAKLAIENAGKVRIIAGQKIGLCIEYDKVGKVENYLIQKEITIDRIEYGNNAVIYCMIPLKEKEGFCADLEQRFKGEIKLSESMENHRFYEPVEESLSR